MLDHSWHLFIVIIQEYLYERCITFRLLLILSINEILYFVISRWYHGALNRTEAEETLRSCSEGSYLVRSLDVSRHEYSLALK